MKVFITIALIVFGLSASSQITLAFPEYDTEFKPRKCVDTLKFIKNGKALKIYLTDCSGRCRIELFDKAGRLIETGTFTSLNDTLYKYRFAKTLGYSEGVHYSAYKIAYLQPLRIGIWKYYKSNGKLDKEVEYFVESR